MLPRSHLDNKSNLRKVQIALEQLNINDISFDVVYFLSKVQKVS